MSAVAESSAEVTTNLGSETEDAVEWLDRNDMITNPEKFRSVFLSRLLHNDLKELGPISFKGNQVEIEEKVTCKD